MAITLDGTDGVTTTGLTSNGIDDNATSTAITIDASQNVGIGAASPSTNLHVSGTGLVQAKVESTDSVARLDLIAADGSISQINLGDASAVNAGLLRYDHSSDYMTFFTNTSERMRIDSSGSVGIGESNPSSYGKLVIKNDTSSGVSSSGSSSIWLLNSNTTANNASTIFFGDNAVSAAGAINLINIDHTNEYGAISFDTRGSGGYAERMRINHTGELLIGPSAAGQVSLKLNTDGSSYAEIEAFNFGIGWDKPLVLQRQAGEVWIGGTTDRGLYNLQVNNTGVWGQGSYVNGSDARWKDNVQTLDCNCLDIVNSLRSVSYTYNEDSGASDLITPHLGFIAQEVEQAAGNHPWLSGLVTEDPQGYKSMAYQELIPVLTKAIQEQQAMIEELKAEVAALKGI